jgi:hypothetical protein
MICSISKIPILHKFCGLRDSEITAIIRELRKFGARVYKHDLLADSDVCRHECGASLYS